MARSLRGLAHVAFYRGDLAAGDYQRRALAIQEKVAPDSLDMADALQNMGSIAQYQWREPEAATAYYRRALALYERLAPNSMDLAVRLHHLGAFAIARGEDLAAASDYQRRALAIQEKLAPNSMAVARSLNNLGILAAMRGDLTAADDYHRRSLSLKEKLTPNSSVVATSLTNLGDVARRRADLASAGAYYQRALAILEKLLPDSLQLAWNLRGMGDLAIQQWDPAAKVYYQRALTIEGKESPNSMDVAISLNNLGNVARLQGDLAVAGEYYQRALALREKQAPNSLATAESLNNLSLIAEKQGALSEAERLQQRAWALVRQQAFYVTGDEALQAFGVSTAEYAARLVRLRLAMGKPGDAFITLEEGRAQALQQLVLERQAVAKATESTLWPTYQAAVTARDRAEQALSRASTAEALARRALATLQAQHTTPEVLAKAHTAVEAATKKYEEAQSTYTRARVNVDELWADIKKKAPRAFAQPLTLEQAQKALPAGTLFVAFSVGEEQSHVFLLGAGRDRATALSVHSIPVSSKELEALVRVFREHLTKPLDVNKTAAASRALFRKLFPPEMHTALASTQRLLISPDGPLWEVSFAGLITNTTGPPKYLGEEKAITYTQSLTLFAQSRNDAPQLAQGSKVSALVVGNPVFDRTPVNVASVKSQVPHVKGSQVQLASNKPQPQSLQTNLGSSPKPETRPPRQTKLISGERSYLFAEGNPPLPLPRTRTEALEIARLYGAGALLEAAATEAELRKQIGSADVVHLATHGYLNPVRAMSSGLLLTEPEKEPETGETDNDGVLQAWEIHSQLKLRAELVVLSACETGRGQQVRGEGMVGMIRALQYAGARSIVASQWKVQDRSTARLMVAFHRNLRQGMAKDAALLQAMAEVRRQSKRTAHPYYWAAFMLTGDPENPNLGQGPR